MPERKLEATVHAQKDVAVTPNQLRLRMRSLAAPMSGQIEQAADHIIASATDEAVKRAALRWKIEGVPALRKALFEPDPFAAVMDTFVLLNQMADYFEHGPGREALRESAGIAVVACRHMEDEFAQIVGSMTISGDVSRVREFARKWAADHPIRHAIAGRESALGRVLERDAASFHSTGEVVAELTTALDDLGRRLELYSDQLFRQARWEAELFSSDIQSELKLDRVSPLAERAVSSGERAVSAVDRLALTAERAAATVDRLALTGERAVATVDRLALGVERALGLIEDAPKLLVGERDAVIRALRGELTRTIDLVREERIAILEYVSGERIATLAAMREILVEERKGLTQDMEQITLKVVDHIFWRAAQLLALLVVALLVAFASVVFARKRSSGGDVASGSGAARVRV